MESDFLQIWQFIFLWYQNLIDLYSKYFITRLFIDTILIGFIVSLISGFLHFRNSDK